MRVTEQHLLCLDPEPFEDPRERPQPRTCDARRRGARRCGRVVRAVDVHLDHSSDLDEIRACIGLGCTSVMVDESRLPFEENIALARRLVTEARAAGVWVEAELGGLAGDEDASTGAAAG